MSLNLLFKNNSSSLLSEPDTTCSDNNTQVFKKEDKLEAA